jgi:predicted metalloprotease with PDZ domain
LFGGARTLTKGSTPLLFLMRFPRRPGTFSAAAFSLAALGLATANPAYAAPPTRISYTVAIADIPQKLYRVTVKAEGLTDPNVTFALPGWSPGWYIMTHAYKNISKVAAKDDTGKPVAITQKDNLTWQVATGGAKSVSFSYNVLAKDQDPEAVGAGTLSTESYGFFEPYLDKNHGFVPGPAALMYVVDGKTVPCSVTYQVPTGWKIASANEPTSDPNTFSAPDYDTLADQPAELGKFTRYDKTIDGVPFSIVVVGADGYDHSRLTSATWRIAAAGMKVFGPAPDAEGKPSARKAPFSRYIFQFHFPQQSEASMGLEHLNCTVISMPVGALQQFDTGTISLIAHEYVHAWNVKRIRPEKLGPFDYTKAVRVKDLWWSEGVTDYYAPRLVIEAGLAQPGFWRGYMAEQIGELQNNDARKRVTLEASSLGAWEGRSEGLEGMSYYVKGLLVGMLLDVEMRRATQNKVSLDDLMKELWRETVVTGKGFPDGEIERVASRLTGTDMSAFFNKALRSTEELPYQDVLTAAGLSLEEGSLKIPDLGFETNLNASTSKGLVIGHVAPGSDAEKAGIKEGDTITSIDGRMGLQAAFMYLNEGKKPGDKVTLTVQHGAETLKIPMTLAGKPYYFYRMGTAPTATAAQKAIFTSITGGRTGTATPE